MKPDKEQLYEYMIQYDIQYLNCMSNTKTNKIFKGNAQTPSCFFLLTKQQSSNVMTIYDTLHKKCLELSITQYARHQIGMSTTKVQSKCYV